MTAMLAMAPGPSAVSLLAPTPALMLLAQKLGLVLCRTAGLFSVSPLGEEVVPGVVRAAIAVVVALCLTASPGTPAPPEGSYVLQLAAEGALGLGAGLLARLPFACIEAGVEVTSLSAGLGIASLLDPATEEEVHALTELFSYGALVVFFACGGHHQLLLALGQSLQQVPPGAARLDPATALSVVGLGASLLVLIVQVAAPVMLVALLFHLALALVSRAAPAMNVFSISLVAVLLGGMVALVAGLPVVLAALRQASGQAAALFLVVF